MSVQVKLTQFPEAPLDLKHSIQNPERQTMHVTGFLGKLGSSAPYMTKICPATELTRFKLNFLSIQCFSVSPVFICILFVLI